VATPVGSDEFRTLYLFFAVFERDVGGRPNKKEGGPEAAPKG
jgi:hypothetical protein